MAFAAFLFSACNSGSKSTKDNTIASDTSQAGDKPDNENKESSAATKEIVNVYLQLKNALSKDNGKEAAEAGNKLVKTIESIDKASMSAGQLKVYEDIVEDAKEHAEHIGANPGKIDHQREHFETLSKDIYDMLKADGNIGQKLYYTHCPMYNEGKGANWISETKEIKNPYLGKKMPDCGTIKEELN